MILRLIGLRKNNSGEMEIEDICETQPMDDLLRKDGKFNAEAQWIMAQMIFWKRELMDEVRLDIIEDPIGEAIKHSLTNA